MKSLYRSINPIILILALSFHPVKANLEKHHVKIRNHNHLYYYYKPDSLEAAKTHSLIVLIHGSNASAKTIARYTKFNKLADSSQFTILYPQKSKLFDWNQDLSPTNTDLEFISYTLDHISEIDPNVDPEKIFAAGYSSGGIVAQAVACMNHKKIKALALVSATLDERYIKLCSDIQMPIIMIMGTNDNYVSWTEKTDSRLSVSETIEFWKRNNHSFGPVLETQFLHLHDRDKTSAKLEQSSTSTKTALITITNGGHTWPGKHYHNPLAQIFLGKTNYDIDANQIIMDFFTR